MSVTTKTTMTSERRDVPKSPNRTTRPDTSGAGSRRVGSSHPGSARRATGTTATAASAARARARAAAKRKNASRVATLENARAAQTVPVRPTPGTTATATKPADTAATFGQPASTHFEAATAPAKTPPEKTTDTSTSRQAPKAKKKRAPLARSLSRPTRHGGVMNLLVWSVFFIIPLFLIFNLMMNIIVAQRQYELVDMHSQERSLTQQNEALHQELGYYQAPQDLANRAALLNMFPSTSHATIDLQEGEIQGTPTPAVPPTANPDSQGNLVPAPATRDNDPSGQKAAETERQAKQKNDQQARERDKKKDKEENSAPAQPSADGAAGR